MCLLACTDCFISSLYQIVFGEELVNAKKKDYFLFFSFYLWECVYSFIYIYILFYVFIYAEIYFYVTSYTYIACTEMWDSRLY